MQPLRSSTSLKEARDHYGSQARRSGSSLRKERNKLPPVTIIALTPLSYYFPFAPVTILALIPLCNSFP